jgi:ADP-ribosyl-[dinitrogen reductase] hydrolase
LVIFILTESRTLGGLLGLATGDALGAPLESLPPPPVPVRDMTGGGPHHRKVGGITDDTLQALAIARSLVERNGFDAADILHRLSDTYQKNPEFYGPTSSAVFEGILQGLPPDQVVRGVHEARGSRSNGSVMRGPPLGLYYRDLVQVREVSLACSRLTHYDPVAGECSAVVNMMISRMSRGIDREHALRDALRTCGNGEVREMLSHYWEHPVDSSLDALLATHAALSLFLEAGSFEEALITAVNQGGDADTVGALTGALGGSFWGVEAIPIRWMDPLQGAEEIRQIALALWRVAEH